MIRPLANRRHEVSTSWQSIERRSEFEMHRRRLEIERNRQLLGALDVRSVLDRGFSVLTRHGSEWPIARVGNVESGADLEAFVSDGVIDLTVVATRVAVGAA